MDAPVYQPGHTTRVFFRLTNLSANELRLAAGERYATLIFEKLEEEPEQLYNGAFRDEFEFSGLGEYQDIYRKQMREIEKKTEDLKMFCDWKDGFGRVLFHVGTTLLALLIFHTLCG